MTNFSKVEWYNSIKRGIDFVVVYLDILFLVNFLMNYLVISICSAIVPEGSKHKRKILASVLGGVYGVGFFVPQLNIFYSTISLFLFSTGLVAIMFCPCTVSGFFKALFVFYLSNFILAGGIYMLLPIFGVGVVRNNIFHIKSGYLIFFGGLIGICVLFGIKYAKQSLGRKRYSVNIKYRGYSANCKGMIDTGNKLKDPITGEGIIVIGREVLESLFSKGCSEFALSEWIDSRDLRVIPYKTVGNEGVMIGFLADEVILGNRSLKRITVAISPEVLGDMVLVNCENL